MAGVTIKAHRMERRGLQSSPESALRPGFEGGPNHRNRQYFAL
jgi:hypothetical protein